MHHAKHILSQQKTIYHTNNSKKQIQMFLKKNICRAIQIHKNRDRLIQICSTLRLLARQVISFRGHEENEK